MQISNPIQFACKPVSREFLDNLLGHEFTALLFGDKADASTANPANDVASKDSFFSRA